MSKSKTKDFLLEIGVEELPPHQGEELALLLAANIEKELKERELRYAGIKTYSTARRLAVLVNNLVTRQPDQTIEFRGPPIDIAFDVGGKPTVAAEKFAKTCGVDVAELNEIEDRKGRFLYYKTIREGIQVIKLLPEIVIAGVKKLPISRPMRWGKNKTSFIRPVHWVVMILGKEVVMAEILGVHSSNKTFGHKFHSPKAITLTSPKAYEEVLRKKGMVVADRLQRKQEIIRQIDEAVKIGTVVVNDRLLNEVTDIVEWPIALVGVFNKNFLDLPKEVLISLMEKQQRYFPVVDKTKKLLPCFVFISNIDSKDKERVICGNERVIRARLSDAEYFYHQDKKNPLSDRLEKLKTVMFQDKLGSLYDKTMRLKQLGVFIAGKIGVDVDQTKRAAELAKCDLLTSMVWEFPETQGIMGEYYALGETRAVATAIREQYLPRFAKDGVPATDVGCVLALADRIDTLIGLFGINKIPSGEKDPYGLRRAAMGILRIILEKKLVLDLKELCEYAASNYAGVLENKDTTNKVLSFVYERLHYLYVEQGKSIKVFRAVLAIAPTDLIDFEKRFDAVITFNNLPGACDLIEIYKRIRNILEKNADSIDAGFSKELVVESAEQRLAGAIEQNEKILAQLYKDKKYFEILKVLVDVKPILSSFFDTVMVMVEDKKLRTNRLSLLKELQKMFVLVADISCLI